VIVGLNVAAVLEILGTRIERQESPEQPVIDGEGNQRPA
jgi:hypothetical protein